MDHTNDKQAGTDVTQRYLEFSLGEENYAIPLLKVREVIGVPSTTPIPQAPAHFVGIMNLRGQVITIVDLRKKLGIKPKDQNRDTAVVIVDMPNSPLGVIVDSVNKVLSPAADQISIPPKIDNQKTREYIKNVFRFENHMVLMIDIDHVLDAKDVKIAKAA